MKCFEVWSIRFCYHIIGGWVHQITVQWSGRHLPAWETLLPKHHNIATSIKHEADDKIYVCKKSKKRKKNGPSYTILRIQRSEGKRCRSRKGGLLWAISSGSLLFENPAILIFFGVKKKRTFKTSSILDYGTHRLMVKWLLDRYLPTQYACRGMVVFGRRRYVFFSAGSSY